MYSEPYSKHSTLGWKLFPLDQEHGCTTYSCPLSFLQCWGPQGLESTVAHCIQHSFFLVLNVRVDSVYARQVLSCWAVSQHNPKVEEVDLMCLFVRVSLCCAGWPGIHAHASSTPWAAGGIGMHHHARLHKPAPWQISPSEKRCRRDRSPEASKLTHKLSQILCKNLQWTVSLNKT